ncbi:DUF6884 domain-containing protein [Sphingomonas sp. BK481]|uniref:DUF6884 domain-containing protein n=1 Tax=Sphingomonas sp. BK481 TaxID=2586981 RepID=UPI00161600A5|nr:DUF6884 domain-containing protein [Sphingomonas sp. BK481]MBB3589002.1 hypothetical protein [Sphingomonas sp. BK481]
MTDNAPSAPPLYLVACVSQKLDRRAPAADLYRSDWFRKARTYVEKTGGHWFILSAAHGLVKPSQRLAPYDATLRDLTAAERRLWGEKTVRQLRRAIGPRYAGPIVFLAGRLYREPLLAFAGERAAVPMLGMGIGQQKAWLASQIIKGRERAARAAQLDLFETNPES